MSGPLAGVRVLEFSAIGPTPFAAMMLADHGADVIRVDRPRGKIAGSAHRLQSDPMGRGRIVLPADLKDEETVKRLLRVVTSADILIEGHRPGVMERLGLGPQQCLGANPRLVYGRVTGWGQTGDYAGKAGHDINFIATSGVLDAIGRAGQPPTPPPAVLADFGGGGMLLAFGVLAALTEARISGVGQVVDSAAADGASLLMTMVHGMVADGTWRAERGTNLIDSGAHFYDTYRTSDDRYVAVGAIEPAFYQTFLDRLGIADRFDLADQMRRGKWYAAKAIVAAAIAQRTRDEWCAVFADTDACVTPVLTLAEAPRHPINTSRRSFVEVDGVTVPAPAPRFSAHPGQKPRNLQKTPRSLLSGWGIDRQTVDDLIADGEKIVERGASRSRAEDY